MKLMDTLKRFLGRGLFHLGSLALAAGLTCASPWASHVSTFLMSLFSTYFALILIFPLPRATVRESRYAVPALAGLVTALILGAGLAVSLCAALFAGGSLSFVLRRMICCPSCAQDWLGFIPFMLGWFIWLPQFGVFTADFMILGTILIVGVFSLGIYRIARFLERGRKRSRKLGSALSKIKEAQDDPEIPRKIRSAIKELPGIPDDGISGFGKAVEVCLLSLSVTLEAVKRHVDPDTGRPLTKIEYEICADGALNLISCLADELERTAAPQERNDDLLLPYETQCRNFETMGRERGSLPPELVAELGRIGRAGREIVRMIYREPAAYESGTAFLKRYLGFADHIVSELVHLSAQGNNEDVERVYKRSAAVLARLSAAFESKAQDLSRRDFEDFEAELKSFEEFMRMRGQ